MGPDMRKILAYSTFAALLCAAPLAQTAHADEISQAMARSGVFATGVDGINAKGELVPGGDAEAQQASGDANIGKHILVTPQAMSGGSGLDRDAYSGVRYPIDPNSMYDNNAYFAR
jgi:hypothetical protein